MRKESLFLVAALTASALALPGASWATGVGYFSSEINWWWSSDLYYSVAGGPASTCGALWAYRNGGPWTETPGWLCTDSSGNSTKGPWSWANQNGDEEAWAYIQWPDGSSTTTAHHIWDKTAPSVSPIPTPPPGSPPSSLAGTANDGAYGAGFDARWASCSTTFQDLTTGLYWTPGASAYSTTRTSVACSISGMPSRSITWNAPQIPPSSAHTVGHCYEWQVCLYDGGFCGYSSIDFCL
jgi:hypothetical protein